jgi:hypothetical protein
VTAWASASADGRPEWLLLDYATAVVPRMVRIHESYCPGAVNRVSVFTEDGQEVEAWHGKDPTPRDQSSGVSEIPVRVDFRTKRVKIYVDSPSVPGWNEIDAVALVDDAGNASWAVGAQASSFYGDRYRTAAAPPGDGAMALAPGWSGLADPAREFTERLTNREERLVDARGWPMLALWCEHSANTLPAGGYALSGFRVRARGPAVGSLAASPLPWRPIWGGFLMDTLIYAGVAGLGYWVLFVPRRFVKELSRMKRGCCISCGYQLGYDFRAGCPECGWRRGDDFPPNGTGRSSSSP